MLILPGALPVAPTPDQAHYTNPAPSPAKVILEAGAATKPRNETGADTGPHSSPQNRKKANPFPDPDRPTGPPPTFEANLLETEREKLHAGPERETQSLIPEESKTSEPQYSKPKIAAENQVDITL